eukprot:TRINITY_DN74553_c0_g1_i1.p1 TRINITY_DN74553_c0_g1~~TRINITY_DN74553_c0_g1_i1.p1  ORF type:complete len:262 (+),score=56.04 TRINITY_DN74553_c0_g1_i1:58-786(+)
MLTPELMPQEARTEPDQRGGIEILRRLQDLLLDQLETASAEVAGLVAVCAHADRLVLEAEAAVKCTGDAKASALAECSAAPAYSSDADIHQDFALDDLLAKARCAVPLESATAVPLESARTRPLRNQSASRAQPGKATDKQAAATARSRASSQTSRRPSAEHACAKLQAPDAAPVKPTVTYDKRAWKLWREAQVHHAQLRGQEAELRKKLAASRSAWRSQLSAQPGQGRQRTELQYSKACRL